MRLNNEREFIQIVRLVVVSKHRVREALIAFGKRVRFEERLDSFCFVVLHMC